ncbi:MAG: DUF1778 domain-containing protein [bacterium]|jgi:uncharacterized protein (DUF1778 family)
MKTTSAAGRLECRLAPDVKRVVELASAELGITITAFAVQAIYERAQEVLKEKSRRVLSDEHAKQFLQILSENTVPNQTLIEAANNYKKVMSGEKVIEV